MPMMMGVYPFRTRTLAAAIYLDGTQRFTARDGFSGVPADYVIPVETYAAATYTTGAIQNALGQGWINQEEYDATVALKLPE